MFIKHMLITVYDVFANNDVRNVSIDENICCVAKIATQYIINPLRAKFFRGNINIYLHFMSFLHIDMTQVLKILPQVREGPTYSI